LALLSAGLSRSGKFHKLFVGFVQGVSHDLLQLRLNTSSLVAPVKSPVAPCFRFDQEMDEIAVYRALIYRLQVPKFCGLINSIKSIFLSSATFISFNSVKIANYEISKTRKFKNDMGLRVNMTYLPEEAFLFVQITASYSLHEFTGPSLQVDT